MMRNRGRILAQAFGSQLARGLFIDVALRPIIKHYVHPRVLGLENLAGLEPPFLLAVNHSSHMDTPLILMSLPFEIRRRTLVAAASDYFYASRPLGLFVSVAVGAVPVERRGATRHTITLVRRVLSQKWCLVMYPEGSRTPDGRLYKGKTGIARLALMAGVPVVPVGIVGTYHSMPGGRSWPVPGQVEVRFGKPLTFERYQMGPPNQIVLRAITDQIMYEIMALTDLVYVDEYSSRAKARVARSRAGQPAAAAPGERAGAAAVESAGVAAVESAGVAAVESAGAVAVESAAASGDSESTAAVPGESAAAPGEPAERPDAVESAAAAAAPGDPPAAAPAVGESAVEQMPGGNVP